MDPSHPRAAYAGIATLPDGFDRRGVAFDRTHSACGAGDRAVSAKTTFFSAAASVTRALASATLPLSGLAVNSSTRSFLENVGGQLEAGNNARARAIASGQIYGSTGVLANDRDFVRFEQGRVQGALNILSSSARSDIVGNINGLLNGPNLTPGFDRDFRSALSETRRELGRDLDFGKMGDRVRLGDNLTDLYRSRQVCTGSRIPGAAC